MTVIFRLQTLWGEQATAKYISLAVFIVTYGVTLACGGLVVDTIQCKPYLPFDYSPPGSLWLEFNPTSVLCAAQVLWVREINSCVVPIKPTALIGVWSGAVRGPLFPSSRDSVPVGS